MILIEIMAAIIISRVLIGRTKIVGLALSSFCNPVVCSAPGLSFNRCLDITLKLNYKAQKVFITYK